MLPILVYVIGLVTMLALSAAYNMWPVLPAKWVLRRFDHSATYLSQEPTRRSSRSTLMLTKRSFITCAVAASSKLSCAMT